MYELCYTKMGTESFPGVKRPGRGADHPPLPSVPRSRKSRAIPLLSLWDFMVCYGNTFTFTYGLYYKLAY